MAINVCHFRRLHARAGAKQCLTIGRLSSKAAPCARGRETMPNVVLAAPSRPGSFWRVLGASAAPGLHGGSVRGQAAGDDLLGQRGMVALQAAGDVGGAPVII